MLPAAMSSFAALPDGAQSAKTLAHHLGWSVPTIYRRFGRRRPIGGAYVLAACLLVAPTVAAIEEVASEGSILAPPLRRPKAGLRATSYALLPVLMREPGLVGRAHEHSVAGVDLRHYDLASVDPLWAPPGAPDVGADRHPVPVGYLPTLTAVMERTLVRAGLPAEAAVVTARHLVETAIARPGSNALGELNRFMDWALPTLGVGPRRSEPELEDVWLVVQLLERLTAAPLDPAQTDLYRVALDELGSRLERS